MEWAWLAVLPMAQRLVDERARHIRVWNYRNELADACNAVAAFHGDAAIREPVFVELHREFLKADAEAAPYTAKHSGLETFRERAFDEDDTVEKAARTLLAQHGFSPARLRRGAERDKTAERHSVALREKYEDERAVWQGLLGEVTAGRRYNAGGVPLTSARIEKMIVALDAKLNALPA